MNTQTQGTISTNAQHAARGTSADEARGFRAQYVNELRAKATATGCPNATTDKAMAVHYCGGGYCTVKGEARTLLGYCTDVAKGACFYVENWPCDEIAGGEKSFATACLGLIAFALDAVDAHYCALDEEHKLPRDNEKMTLKICYGGNE